VLSRRPSAAIPFEIYKFLISFSCLYWKIFLNHLCKLTHKQLAREVTDFSSLLLSPLAVLQPQFALPKFIPVFQSVTWPLTLSEEHRLPMLEHEVPRKIFGP
jgi:hypothetical protein